jgi:hypothetical protein
MAELVWDQIGDRTYETGVSKGVLYEADGHGVSWNGLTSLEESISSTSTAVYFDGIKFNDIVTPGDFSAVMRAFTYPEEFLKYEGTREEQEGLYILQQPQQRFGLSYQTIIGDDINGVSAGYKIHILYNLTALPSNRAYQTLALDVTPLEFEWTISAIPEELDNYRPTAHIIFDSTKIDPNLLADIEDILYGSEDNDAHLPPLKGFISFIRKWDRLIITGHGNGTWTAESDIEGVIIMLDETTFQIESDTVVWLDADTYQISSSDKNEEDIWGPSPASPQNE